MEFQISYKNSKQFTDFLICFLYLFLMVFSAFISLDDILYLVGSVFFAVLFVLKIAVILKKKVKIEDNSVKIYSPAYSFPKKIKFSEIDEMTSERNTIIHDENYDEDAIIVDFKSNESYKRIALCEDDYEKLITAEKLSSKMSHHI